MVVGADVVVCSVVFFLDFVGVEVCLVDVDLVEVEVEVCLVEVEVCLVDVEVCLMDVEVVEVDFFDLGSRLSITPPAKTTGIKATRSSVGTFMMSF